MCAKRFLVLVWLASFALVAALILLAQADQSEFISIDCGLNNESHYIAQPSGINYTSDASFVDSGENVAMLPPTSYTKIFLSARRFPQGERNCYTLRPERGKNNKYLIRAYFMYVNFDSNNETQEFDLYLGEDLWATLRFQVAYDYLIKEIIHTPSTDYIHVCLQKTGVTAPFISGLELRPLKDTLYTTKFGPLELFSRWDLGAEPDKWVRYPDDLYDRWWKTNRVADRSIVLWNYTLPLNTARTVRSNNDFQLPSVVMSTAVAPPKPEDYLYMWWKHDNPSERFYLYLHFADVEVHQSNEIRESQVYLNGETWNQEFSPFYLLSVTKLSASPEKLQTKYELYINSTGTSTLPPIINAMEIYVVKNFKNSGTDDSDVAAMIGIKSYYGLKRNWQGDPCIPQAFTWEGLSCNYDYNNSRIVTLNLSSSRLNGSIAPHIANLTSIRTLDLSNNNLNGTLPDFLAELPNLTVLNLSENNFNGPIPAKLEEKSKHGLLSYSIDEVPNTKKRNVILPIVASLLAVFLVVSFVYITACTIKRRKRTVIKKVEVNLNKNRGALETKNRQLTYSEILEITNNFESVIGKGGSGTVYYGVMGEMEVAVKMLNPSSAQGHKEFHTEANLLMSVHHKNLTCLVGYCNEGCNTGIIYEYMANGNFQQHLSEFSWEQRLRIAGDVAQGLEYLHHGCKPPIIHRDVKNTNILLNEKFQAKLSDFGISKAFASESGTHVSTNTIIGSPGYMDPEYYFSYKLTEKSDVYSFGIVLLEIITGRPALDMNRENRHITEWVVPFLKNGDIRTIVDKRFEGNFSVNSAWKAFELAMCCVSRRSTRRPTMSDVVIELKECLALQTSENPTQPTSVTGPILESEYGPLVR